MLAASDDFVETRVVAEITTKDVDAWLFSLKHYAQSRDKNRRATSRFQDALIVVFTAVGMNVGINAR